MCDLFYFNLMIISWFLPFQTLLKGKETTEDIHTEVVSKEHPEVAIDLEVVKITSENSMTSNGVDAAKTTPKESTDGTDRAGEVDV
jgi:hypothetical protein